MREIGEKKTIWIQTPLSKFGSKCIMNKHDSCQNSSCGCLCHPFNSEKLLLKEKTIAN